MPVTGADPTGGRGGGPLSEISAPPPVAPKKFKIGRHLPKFSAKVIKFRIGKQRFHVL